MIETTLPMAGVAEALRLLACFFPERLSIDRMSTDAGTIRAWAEELRGFTDDEVVAAARQIGRSSDEVNIGRLWQVCTLRKPVAVRSDEPIEREVLNPPSADEVTEFAEKARRSLAGGDK